MSAIHAGPFRPYAPGLCAWRWHHEDVHLACDDTAIPGTDHCADHYIAAAHARADAEARENARRAA